MSKDQNCSSDVLLLVSRTGFQDLPLPSTVFSKAQIRRTQSLIGRTNRLSVCKVSCTAANYFIRGLRESLADEANGSYSQSSQPLACFRWR